MYLSQRMRAAIQLSRRQWQRQIYERLCQPTCRQPSTHLGRAYRGVTTTIVPTTACDDRVTRLQTSAHDAKSCLSVRTQPLMATGAPSQTSTRLAKRKQARDISKQLQAIQLPVCLALHLRTHLLNSSQIFTGGRSSVGPALFSAPFPAPK